MAGVEKSVAEPVVMICEDAKDREKRQTIVEALRERGLNESKLAAMCMCAQNAGRRIRRRVVPTTQSRARMKAQIRISAGVVIPAVHC